MIAHRLVYLPRVPCSPTRRDRPARDEAQLPTPSSALRLVAASLSRRSSLRSPSTPSSLLLPTNVPNATGRSPPPPLSDVGATHALALCVFSSRAREPFFLPPFASLLYLTRARRFLLAIVNDRAIERSRYSSRVDSTRG